MSDYVRTIADVPRGLKIKCWYKAGGFEGGNPHDVGDDDQHEHDSCPGAE